MKSFLISFLISMLMGAAALGAVFHFAGKDLPSPERLNTIQPALKTKVYDRENRLIGEFYRQDRSLVRLEEVPAELIDAFIAVEDRRFYEHWGIDIKGVTRAAVRNLAAGGIEEGASTITQQLARNLFLTHKQTARRKLKEAVLALRIEQTYSKNEILEMYLNQIYFGEGAYGVKAAARRIFGKDVQDLSLSECAILAGLPRNPRYYSPRRNPDHTKRRRAVVLASMEDFGVITHQQRTEALAESLMVSSNPLSEENAPYFMEMVRRYVEAKYGTAGLYEDGLVIRTTLDLQLQQEMERAVEDHLTLLETQNRAKQTRQDYLEQIEAEESPRLEYLQGSAMTIDPASGSILAMVGGRSFEESAFNRATQAKRQPGSAFKPFVFLAGIDHGFYPGYIIMDTPVEYHERGQEVWAPKNYDLEFRGPVTLRYALQKSLNVPTVKLQEEFGPAEVAAKAKAAGIKSGILPVRSIALGTEEVTLEEITFAYAVFANSGIRVEPLYITRIEDHHGNVLEETKPERQEVLKAQNVALLNDMLASVMDHGTGFGARASGFRLPAAGKTGTTDDYSDAWFIGFTPRVVTGVWVGYDTKKTIGRRMTGAAAALPIWTRIMKAATEGDEAMDLEWPDTLVRLMICPDTGLPADTYCPEAVEEVFTKDHIPQDTCFLHSQVFDRGLRERWSRDRDDKDSGP